jgi:GLPGLI family protein
LVNGKSVKFFVMNACVNTTAKKKAAIWMLWLLVAAGLNATAQTRFVSAGKIEYEKKVNMHKMLEDDSWTRELKDRMPVYRVSYHDLIFDSIQSIYKIGREPAEDKWKNMWMSMSEEENLTYHHFGKQQSTLLKQVFEKKFLIEDSVLAIEWRITDETRTIAGFDCKKAVGRFYDSLYVVAFYTDQITVPAGPGIYTGLPGTILGLAFPRFYTTWFATKVTLTEPATASFVIPTSKSTKINRAEMMRQVRKTIDWGSEEERQKSFWQIVL